MSDPWKDTLATEAYLNDDGGAAESAEREAIRIVMDYAKDAMVREVRLLDSGIYPAPRIGKEYTKCMMVKDALATLAARYGDTP